MNVMAQRTERRRHPRRHHGRPWLAAAILGMLLALPALASGEGGENNIFAGDVGNVIWTLAIFGVAGLVLAKYAWGPVLRTLQAREDFIHDSLAKAKADREAAEARLGELEERFNKARAEATAIVEEGRRDADVTRQRMLEEARAEARKEMERAKREIAIARESAIKELYTVSGNLAVDIAARILGRELATKDHERLIREAIDEVSNRELTH